MNNKSQVQNTVTIICILILIASVTLAIRNFSNTQNASTDTVTDSTTNDIPTSLTDTSISESTNLDSTNTKSTVDSSQGKYIQFSPEVLASSKNTRRVLYFYANWCPTCKVANENFISNINKIPSDVTLIRINYDDTETDEIEKDLAAKYAITYQHSFVQIDIDDNKINFWNGGDIDLLLKNLQ